MEIILVRHGQPDIDTTGKVSASGFGGWVEQYDKAGIHPESLPTIELTNRVKKCSYIVCSNLLRSIDSAKLLAIAKPNLTSAKFRECEIPYSKWRHPKLPIKMWSVLFRLFQIAGYSQNSESYTEIKARASQCAIKLQELSKVHQSVAFVGHGVINYFIHKQLLNSGWVGAKKSTRKHWDHAIYKCKI